YVYINPTTILGHDTYILYDHKLKTKILQYNEILGYYEVPLFGGVNQILCNDFEQSPFALIKDYLN
ncbi:hypothetical protein ACE4RU_11990, partial [Actinobacillus seminis]